MSQKLDYTPLNDKDPVPLASELTNLPSFNNTAGALIITAMFVTFTAILILPILLSPLIYKFVKRYISKSGYSAIKMSNFAVTNGFRYRWGHTQVGTAERVQFPGIMGADNTGVLASNIVEGSYKDFDFTLFSPYQKGFYTIMKVKLHNKYPHIVLDSRDNNPFISNIGHFFSEDARIGLEGDFEKYFKVYATAPAVDTLRILSPDMMQLMIDSGHKYDIEIVGDSLHVISNFKFSDEVNVEQFFTIVDTLLNKLDRRTATRLARFDSESRVS